MTARGVKTSIAVLRGDLCSHDAIKSIVPNVPLLKIEVPLKWWVLKFDGLLFHFNIGFSLLRWYQVHRLKKYISESNFDIIHSHLLPADIVTSRASNSAGGIPWITTMHGDYLALESRGHSRAARILDFEGAVREVEKSVSTLVSITDQQQSQLKRLMPRAVNDGRLRKIFNGYKMPSLNSLSSDLPIPLHSIPEGNFVFGMVSRGIKEKGWDVLIGAFEMVCIPDAWLVLVGDGDHIQKLRAMCRNPRIIFCGDVVDPLRYIARFDVACLPSQFATESLPTVIIEYMLLGKPVIATAVGEIPVMLEVYGNVPAGLLIELGETATMVPQMMVALEHLHDDKLLRASMGTNALRCAQKFDMDDCVNSYLDVYASALR